MNLQNGTSNIIPKTHAEQSVVSKANTKPALHESAAIVQLQSQKHRLYVKTRGQTAQPDTNRDKESRTFWSFSTTLSNASRNLLVIKGSLCRRAKKRRTNHTSIVGVAFTRGAFQLSASLTLSSTKWIWKKNKLCDMSFCPVFVSHQIGRFKPSGCGEGGQKAERK